MGQHDKEWSKLVTPLAVQKEKWWVMVMGVGVRESPPPTPREAYLPQRPGCAHEEGTITSRASSASNQRGSHDKAESQGESQTRKIGRASCRERV